MWDPYALFEERTLDNNLKVHACQWPNRPWQRVAVVIHSGASSDPVGREGLAHFVEHMTFSNTPTDTLEINTFFADLGGETIGGGTNYEGTEYGFMLPADHRAVARGLEFLAEFACDSSLDQRLEHERQVILGEFRRKFPIDFKSDSAWRERKALHGHHWPSRFISALGHPESIKAITLEDLRTYYDAHYVAPNMSIVGVGGLSADELAAIVRDSPFGRLPNAGIRRPLREPLVSVSLLNDHGFEVEISKHLKTDQVFDRCEYATAAYLPGAINNQTVDLASDMISHILDGEVRQRRSWAYHIGSGWSQFCRSGYEFSISGNALALAALPEIEKIVADTITSLPNQDQLFERLKRRELASQLLWDATGKKVFEGAVGDLTYLGRIFTRAENGQDLERVTLADIGEVVKWLTPDYRFTVITRP